MTGALLDATAWAADSLDPLSRHETFVRAVELGVRYESLLRCAMEQNRRLLRRPVGRPTPMQRRRSAEFAKRPGPTGGPEAAAQHTGPVNWHDGGSGPTVLLLNGWGASGLMWPGALVDELERDFRVIRPDNRGSGWSRSALLPCTIADLADDAASILADAGSASAIVLGISMGGMIAQELALRHPRLVTGLILAGTRPPAPLQVAAAGAVMRQALAPMRPGQAPAEYYREVWTGFAGPGFAPAHPDRIEELVAQILRRQTPRRLMVDQARAIGAWHGARRLARLDVPTVVVHGAQDRLMPVGNGMRLAQSVPAATYVELTEVGHLVPQEAPEVLADWVHRFAR
jgi:pimeloyl-ACP methyl ester carboxylesterase